MNNYKMFAKYTSCLYNVIEDYPNLLENLVLSTEERTARFIETFISMWFNYEVGLETIGLFKLTLEERFKRYKYYYEELLDVYETKINYLDGKKITKTITENNVKDDTYNTDNITLPRVPNTSAIPSSKIEGASNSTDNRSHIETITGDENIINLKVEYMKQIRNIYEEFAMEFKSCFIQLFN